MSLHVSPLGEVSQFPIAFGFPGCFGDSSLCYTSQELVYLMWVVNPSFLRKKLWVCEMPPDCGSQCQGWGSDKAASAFFSHLDVTVLSCKGGIRLVFWSFAEGTIPYVAVDLVCPWEVSS